MRRLIALFLLTLAAGSLADEKIKLMYSEPELELRAAILTRRLELLVEVYRIGMFRVGDDYYGVVRLGGTAPKGILASRQQITTTAAQLCDQLFGDMPNLLRLDFESVTFRETHFSKPDVLFSASVARNTWGKIPKSYSGSDRIKATGLLYFDSRIISEDSSQGTKKLVPLYLKRRLEKARKKALQAAKQKAKASPGQAKKAKE